jgi:2-polyprenyl-3-methyl-5-hydroxy-6-metoxy-1,4-benzoquinol methylase
MEKEEYSAFWDQPEDTQGDYIRNLKRLYHETNILPLLNNLRENSSLNILEFGPGMGIFANLLHETFPQLTYTAIDIDNSVLERIKSKYPDAKTFCVSSAKELENALAGKDFDAIVALDVWEHLPPDELSNYTRLCLNNLSEKGIFIAQVPNWGCPFAPNIIFAGDLTHQNRFNELSARQLLLNAGAPSDKIKLLPYKFPKPNIFWSIRSWVRAFVLWMWQILLIIIGLYKVNITTPNLIMLVDKGKDKDARTH